MSRDAEIIVVASSDEDDNIADLSFWLGTSEALDAEAVRVIREVAGQLSDDSGDVSVAVPLDTAGHLMPLTGAVGDDLWGGFKSLSVTIWGGVTSNMHWDRFLEQVAKRPWRDRERVQLFIKDDGDTYFRAYMFRGQQLTNVIPEPEERGFDRPW